jgi:hypothetical protein
MTGPLFCTSCHYHKKRKITWFSISKWSFHMNALTENGVGAKFCSCRHFPTDAFCCTTQVYSETSWIEDFNDIGAWGVSTSFNFAKLRNFWTPCRTSYVDELSSIKYILGTLRNSDVKEYWCQCRRASQVLLTCKLVTTFTTHQSHPFFLCLHA